jgi:hypothetical protein
MIASTNCGLFITAHTTSDNCNTVSPSDGDVETAWLDIIVSESDGERPHVEKIVNDRLQHYIETIEHTKTTVLAQETVKQQQNQTINNLTNKINKLGSRIEEQEQYSLFLCSAVDDR